MNRNRNNMILISFAFFCLMLFVQNAFGQDSSSTGTAKITLAFGEQDSLKEITATVTQADATGKETAVKDVDVHFYVKKSFGLLPLEGDFTTTDESGKATVEFPNDLPGDASGNVTVIAKVEDNDELGELETSQTMKWGVPATAHEAPQRALWASGENAPLPLVIMVTSMVVGVWGVIFYICYQLIVIKRAGKYREA